MIVLTVQRDETHTPQRHAPEPGAAKQRKNFWRRALVLETPTQDVGNPNVHGTQFLLTR